MKDTYHVNSWKYPLIFTGLVVTIATLLVVLESWTRFIVPPALSDFFKLLGLLPILFSILSTVIPGFLSAKVKNRITWLVSQPGMNQLYFLLAFEVFVIIATTILKIILPQVTFFTYLDLSANLFACLTLIVAYTLLLRVLRNN